MKRLWHAFTRKAEASKYKGNALEQFEKIEAGQAKVVPPKYPTEKQRGPTDPEVRSKIQQELNAKKAELVEHVNKITIKSTDPPERWISEKELPSHAAEQQMRKYDRNWEFGFYEPPDDKIPDKRLTFREVLQYLRARNELTESREKYILLHRKREDELLYMTEEHPMVKRMEPETLDNIFEYFRVFEKVEKQQIVFREDLDYLYDYCKGRVPEHDFLAIFDSENWRKIKEKWAQAKPLPSKDEFQNMEKEEKQKLLDAIHEVRQKEHERLHENLDHASEAEEKLKQYLERAKAKENQEPKEKEKVVSGEKKNQSDYGILQMLKERVAIALSGGVDSAVSAFLLKRAGYDLVGVHMINWDPVEEGTSQCTRTVDEADAKEVARKLKIPFETVNFVKEYWNEVFVGMVENYRRGRTIVPDIACNRHIKFRHLHDFAIKKLGAKFIATGHYATISRSRSGTKLLTAVDRLKDQTYFLCTLSQLQLGQAIFPLGSLTKPIVKRIAREQGFDDVSRKPESMGICFVGKRNNFDEFMDQYTEPKKGDIVTLDGERLATHSGVHHFTIGKRLHLHSSRMSHLKFFVGDIDVETNTVLACAGTHNPYLFATEFSLDNLHLISGKLIDSGNFY
ncbi:hypothetical protein WR25_15398 [Diploscapter pachys]|uniref:tRNA-5-taurinomethyluridine 2-sulfurtransferase n=1 Tax=Diploscapter pachys TaxID=2018661 RepID=A0A2A2LU91_9BILA|nr:hypothetical protein WR25_15398 [Diploscapter pachys]